MAAVLRIGGEHESEWKLSYPLNFRVMSDRCERLSECQWLTGNGRKNFCQVSSVNLKALRTSNKTLTARVDGIEKSQSFISEKCESVIKTLKSCNQKTNTLGKKG